jgi:uncharacterized membrane protein YcjF (UPF0283 family)
MIDFLNGAAAAGSIGVGLFFLRLWRETRDRFFALFGFAFGILALNWIALLWAVPEDENRHYFYLIRLLAFLLIIAAIVDKNRSTDPPRP